MAKGFLLLVTVLLLQANARAQFPNILIGTQRTPNEPSICIDPRNPQSMVVGVNIDTYYTSFDEGHTWNEARLFSNAYGVWGDPCIVVDTMGYFYFFHLSNPPGPAWIDQIVCQRSEDYGISWTDGTGIGLDGTKAQDKEWAVVNPFNNHIYVTWTQFDAYGSADPADSTIIRFSKSVDKGLTFSEPVRINKVAGDCIDSDNTVEGAVPAVGPEGQIYVSWSGPEGIVFDRSFDEGETWLDDDIFVTDQPGGWDFSIPGIFRANGMPVTCCDLSNGPNRGTIYINWSDQRNGTDDTDVWLVKSTDLGSTWSQPVRVNDDKPGKHQFFTWMTVDQSDGRLWFVFYDRREQEDAGTDVYVAYSVDGGETFVNLKVSEEPFVPTSNIFFGDYTSIAAVDGIVRPVWTRLHENQLSMWTAIMNDVIPAVKEPDPDAPVAGLKAVPNPFNEAAAISFRLRDDNFVSLDLYDLMGRKLASLIDHQFLPAGKYVEYLNLQSHGIPAGVYMLRLISPAGQSSYKIVFSG